MANGSGLARLRGLVPPANAIDLADAKQMVVVTDHDSKGFLPDFPAAEKRPRS